MILGTCPFAIFAAAIIKDSVHLFTQNQQLILRLQSSLIHSIAIRVIVIDTVVRYILNSDSMLVAVWLQALNPFARLNIIFALTRHRT